MTILGSTSLEVCLTFAQLVVKTLHPLQFYFPFHCFQTLFVYVKASFGKKINKHSLVEHEN